MLIVEGKLELRRSDLAAAVPVLFGPLLFKELLVLLLSLDFLLELRDLLLFILVLLDEPTILLLDRRDLTHIRLQMLRQLLCEQLVHVVLQIRRESVQLLGSSLSCGRALVVCDLLTGSFVCGGDSSDLHRVGLRFDLFVDFR